MKCVDQLSVNGIPKTLPLANLDDWKWVKTFYTILNPGDVVLITGNNIKSIALGNPAGILATIWYIDQNGNNKILNTGLGWIYNGRTSINQAANNLSTSIWFTKNSGSISSNNNSSQWILELAKQDTATCTVKFLVNKKIRARRYDLYF